MNPAELNPGALDPGAPLAVGHVSDIPVGEGRAFAVEGEQVAVFRLRDGRLRAVQAVCPHAGGPLADGQVDGEVLMCPLHGHAFGLDDGTCRTHDSLALVRWHVAVNATGELLLARIGASGPLQRGSEAA